jgi:hypothetical protein
LTKGLDKYTLQIDSQISNLDHFLDHKAKSELTG